MPHSLTLRSIADIEKFTETIIPMLEKQNVVCFSGDLGAGKTTCIKRLCEDLGVNSQTASPSFSIVNEYVTKENHPIYHFDLYRLNKPDELLDIGWEDYLNTEAILLIEWPEMAEQFMPENAIQVKITANDDHSRTITIN